jgi:hypothetical protein
VSWSVQSLADEGYDAMSNVNLLATFPILQCNLLFSEYSADWSDELRPNVANNLTIGTVTLTSNTISDCMFCTRVVTDNYVLQNTIYSTTKQINVHSPYCTQWHTLVYKAISGSARHTVAPLAVNIVLYAVRYYKQLVWRVHFVATLQFQYYEK